jgi:CDP-diacylglycerol--serine O-phosphatidyltransferase
MQSGTTARNVIHEIKLKDIATFLGTFFGFISILVSITSRNYFLAAAFIVSGIGIDLIDGFLARKMNQMNAFGKQLDSISDAIVFGVAPAILIYCVYSENPTITGLNGHAPWYLAILCFFYLVGVMARLAWFNILEFEGYQGLPSPIGAGILILAVMTDLFAYFVNGETTKVNSGMFYFILLLLPLLSWLMITDRVLYGKTIRGKTGFVKIGVIATGMVFFGMILITYIPIPHKMLLYNVGLIIFWVLVFLFLGSGFYTAHILKKVKNL